MRFIFELSIFEWIVVIIAALFIGINKTGLPTLGVLILTMLLIVFPPEVAIGVMLPMLIIADIFATILYRRNVVWKQLVSLIPWVIAGILVGYVVLRVMDSGTLRFIIGIIVMGLILLQLLQERLDGKLTRLLPTSIWFVAFMGVLGGFATMVGNAAGEVMAIYLIVKEVPKKEFVGTVAWFFFIVNLIKLPFYIQLGMIDYTVLKFSLLFTLIIILGAVIGMKILPRIPQKIFRTLVLVLATIGGLKLLI